jgi:hypothetical protein
MLIHLAREVCKKFRSYCVLGVFHWVQLQAWEPCSPMEDPNKFTKYCMTITPQVLKSLCVPMLQRKNSVHANVCGKLSPQSTCCERFSCNTQQTIHRHQQNFRLQSFMQLWKAKQYLRTFKKEITCHLNWRFFVHRKVALLRKETFFCKLLQVT